MSGIDPGTLHLSRLGLEPKPRPCSTGANAWDNAISSLVLTLLQPCQASCNESTLTQFLQIMKSPNSANFPGLEDQTFLLLVVVISLAFAWILWPFFGAVLWGTILAIMFAPLYRRLLRNMRQRRTVAALATVTIVLLIVILPLTLIGALLVQEALGVYGKFQSGELDLGRYVQQVLGALPGWVSDLLNRFGLTNLGSMQDKLSTGLLQGSQLVAAQAFNIGQNTLDLVVNLGIVLYLLFFLLRDGDDLARRIRTAVPLHANQQRELFNMFTTVIRATVKGNVVMAIVQGALGGLIFWFLGVHASVLWAVVMAFLSLLPAVGSALVWLPVAIYFLVTGATWQGIVLIAYGVLVIGMVDNVLRPILVGKDTKMPDYVVLISTLGGMAIFGLNGFVIGPVIAAMFMAVWDIFASSRARSHN
jgi:predicted PurR-regulated permease PerM